MCSNEQVAAGVTDAIKILASSPEGMEIIFQSAKGLLRPPFTSRIYLIGWTASKEDAVPFRVLPLLRTPSVWLNWSYPCIPI